MPKKENENQEKIEVDAIEDQTKEMIETLKKDMEKGLMTKPVLSKPEYATCRNLVVQYYQIQEIRKAVNNAKIMIERDYKEEYPEFDTKPQEEIIKHVEEIEKKITDELQSHIEKLRIYGWLRLIKGIGPIISIGLISGFQTPDKFSNPSKMIRYAGLAPVEWCSKCDNRYIPLAEQEAWALAEAIRIEERKAKKKQDIKGRQKKILKKLCKCEVTDKPTIIHVAEKKRKGLPIHYNPFLKTLTAYKIGNLGFIMHKKGKKGYYRTRYEEFRKDEDRKRPDLSDGHRLARARRKTVKLFIQHFWNAWRRANGLSIVTPYVMKTGGHNYIPPPYDDVIKYLEWEWEVKHKK